MRKLTWQEYYDGFYNWAESTQKSYSYRLEDFGPPAEVAEIAEELHFHDKGLASGFLNRAVDAGVRFKPEQVLELAGLIDQQVLEKMAEASDEPFTEEELEEIYGLVEDDTFQRLSRRAGIDVLSDLDGLDLSEWKETHNAPVKRAGFMVQILTGLGLYDLLARWRRHRRR